MTLKSSDGVFALEVVPTRVASRFSEVVTLKSPDWILGNGDLSWSFVCATTHVAC